MTIETLVDDTMCPFFNNCIPIPDDNEVEDYCVVNYEECPRYIKIETERRENV